jgi:hypothetical protein
LNTDLIGGKKTKNSTAASSQKTADIPLIILESFDHSDLENNPAYLCLLVKTGGM